jgi:hypothetical protein
MFIFYLIFIALYEGVAHLGAHNLFG